MIRLDADKPVHFCDGLTRRDFLHAGSLGVLGLTLPDMFALKALGAVDPGKDVNCIMLMLVGAPSQLDTWDMKPEAPAEIRGPYKRYLPALPASRYPTFFRAWPSMRTSTRWCDLFTTLLPLSTTPATR
jgi:hypothetical protein